VRAVVEVHKHFVKALTVLNWDQLYACSPL